MKLADIQIRDPFVVVNDEDRRYYMYGSTDKDIWNQGNSFEMYVSSDLDNWEGPHEVFKNYEGFIADRNFWAPEVHPYQGAYYMFATFRQRDNELLGTAILKSDSLYGPFVLHSDGVATPKEWCSLDGSLYVDEQGVPWMVFCHEWQQVQDGEVCVIQLADDLSRSVGEPIVLFKASEAKWPTPFRHPRYEGDNYVTDGSFAFRNKEGKLCLLWASFIDNVYAQGVAISKTGKITGPWIQADTPLYTEDGGHAMLFYTFEGQRILSLHGPNKTPNERAKFIAIDI